MREVVIAGAVRSAVGRARKGILRETRPDDLAAQVMRGLIKKTGIDPAVIEDIRMGCAMPEGEQGMNVARIAQFISEIPNTVPAVTLNRFCASGLEAIVSGCYRIAYGDADAILAGGLESMTMVPMTGYAFRPNPQLSVDYPEVYTPMGITAENLAERWKISRKEQDEFAYWSHMKAARASEAGRFDDEIVPVIARLDGREVAHRSDETIRADTTLEALAALPPSFKEGGSVTAGNSSPLTDGASAVLLTSREKAQQVGLKPLARFVTAAVVGVNPEIMGIAPAYALPKALQQAGVTIDDIDLIEFNEAFAAQALAVVKELQMERQMEKINVNGGAIALGHALGSSGARLTTTLVHELQKRQARFGLVTMCVGGGQGMAAIFEGVH